VSSTRARQVTLLLLCGPFCFSWGSSSGDSKRGNGTAPDEVHAVATSKQQTSSNSNLRRDVGFPLKISANGRYLVDQNRRPFRIQGDSAQSLIANLSYAEAQKYLSDRKAKGFNSVNVNLIEHKFAIRAPANRNGDAPFTIPGNFATPNEAYFAFADSIIELAASKGMLISLAPMYLGYKGGDEGWWAELNNPKNSQTVCFKFGLYIGNRYKNRTNILWVIGGDYLPPAGSEGEARLYKFMQGVKASGANQLWAGDWDAPCISTDEALFAASMDLNAVYTSGMPGVPGTTYDEAHTAYNYAPPHPAYLKETGYEDENWVPGNPASIRKYEYWAILGGATAGGFFGNRDIWEFATQKWWSGFAFGHRPWQEALDSTGALDMMRLGQLLDSLPWFDLVPSDLAGMKTLVSSGGGSYGKLDYVSAAVTAEGRTLVVYIPPRAVAPVRMSVDMTQLRNPVTAQWYDPTSGKYLDVRGGPFPNAGVKSYLTPGKNSAGATDWVLVLRTTNRTRK